MDSFKLEKRDMSKREINELEVRPIQMTTQGNKKGKQSKEK